MPIVRHAVLRGHSVVSGGPVVVGSALTAQKETEGTQTVVAALSVATAGIHLIHIDGLLTAIRSGPTLNNGNSFTLISAGSQDYSPGFPQYTLQLRTDLSVTGGSNHSATTTKADPAANYDDEATAVLIGVSGGTTIDATSVNRTSTAGVATHTSASYDIAGSATARVFAVWSGSGFSGDSTIQDATMVTSGWSDLTGTVNGTGGQVMKYVHSGVSAPNGHIPIRIWERTQAPGTGYTWQVTPTYQVSAGQAEGGILITIVVR